MSASKIIDNIHTQFFPDFIPLEEVLWDDKTIVTKNFNASQALRLSGIDYQGLSSERLEELHAIRRAFFADEELANKVDIAFHLRRREVQYSDRIITCQNNLVQTVAARHLSHYKGGFITEITIVISLPLGNLITNYTGVPSEDFTQENKKLTDKVKELNDITDRIKSRLSSFDPQVLKHTRDCKSPLLDFWSYIINAGMHKVIPKQEGNLNDNLCLTDIEFFPRKKLTVFTDNKGNQKYAAYFALKYYPSETTSTIMDDLMQLQLPISLVQFFAPQDKEKTKLYIEKLIKKLFGGIAFARGRIHDLTDAANRIDSENLNFHKHIFILSVFGNSEAELNSSTHQIETTLSPTGISIIRESINMQPCFFGQFPDRVGGLKARERLISPDNLAQFITFAGAHEGHTHSAFGNNPVAPFKRPDGSLYNFNWHPDPYSDTSGHTFVCGAPGSGKTTLVMFLIMMSLDLAGQDNDTPLKTLIFDSGKGAKIPSLAFDGIYNSVGEDANLNLNPFSLPETSENKAYLERFIEMLAGGKITELEKGEISEVVRQNYQLPENVRRICEVRELFGLHYANEKHSSLATKLDKWLPDKGNKEKSVHRNGMIFNGQLDSLNFDKQIVSFDMTQALKDSDLLAPLTSYIFHKFNSYVTHHPTPHIVFIDECKQYLEHEIFGEHLLKLLREQRKKNGSIIMAGQEPTILTSTKNGQTALQNIETFIIWPNASATKRDYMDGLNLNDSEFDFVKNPTGEHKVLVKRKNGTSVIIDVDLKHLGKYLNLFHSSAKKVKKVESLQNTNPNDWISEYLKQETKGA